jgi:hypothetical protein
VLIGLYFFGLLDAIEVYTALVGSPHYLVEKIPNNLMAVCRDPNFASGIDYRANHARSNKRFTGPGRSLNGQHASTELRGKA